MFGRLVTGWSMLQSSLQNVVGPCLTEVPIRIIVGAHDTVSDLATRLQSQFIEDSKHEAAGMVEIIRHSTHWSTDSSDSGLAQSLPAKRRGRIYIHGFAIQCLDLRKRRTSAHTP